MKKLVVTAVIALSLGISSGALAGSACCPLSKSDSKKSDSTAKVTDAKKSTMTAKETANQDKIASTKPE